jgi:lipid-binding SYLF domain-containing protein
MQPGARSILLSLTALICLPAIAAGQWGEAQTVEASTAVLNEMMSIPASQIPASLLAGANGVAIIPNVIKGGFVVGVRHGKGVMLTRDEQGQWQLPVFVTLTGGSVGWQAGVQATDVVLVFRTRNSIANLMNGTLTIGVDAAAAAGPVGRQAAAATDTRLAAEILSYSRSRGLFAGVSIDGSSLTVDQLAGARYYQAAELRVAPGNAQPTVPTSAVKLIQQLTHYAAGANPAPPEWTPPVQGAPVSVRQPLDSNLTHAMRRLQDLLDVRWREYLMIPTDIATAPPSRETAQQMLQRFDAIAADPRYARLAQLPEFATAHQLLREYLSAVRPAGGQLDLPPPPTPARNP